jgi:alkanesulfonate monooxygenase SsuD/methylene tetrahydromethanopterin reductase-like flavin-dependent oxidoreductase (luciferase family)
VGANSDAAVRRGARLADGWMVGFGDRLPTAADRIATFRAESARHDRRGEICLMRLVGLGATRLQVEETWLPDVLTMLRGYARAGAPQDRNDDVRTVARSDRPTLEGLGNDLFVAGTPDDVIAGLQRAIEMTACEYVMPSMSGGADALAPIELFGKEVLPAFA